MFIPIWVVGLGIFAIVFTLIVIQLLVDDASKAAISFLSSMHMHDMEVLKKEFDQLKRENFILRSGEKESLRAQLSQYAERLDYANSRPDNLELLKKLSTSIKYNCSNLGDTRYLTIEFLFKDLYMSQQDKLFEILNELTKETKDKEKK